MGRLTIKDGVIIDTTVWKHRADATLSQANPISGTKYTVLDTTSNVKIHHITVIHTWTVQPTPLEVHLTIDGQSYTAAKANATSDTEHEVRISDDLATAFELHQMTGTTFVSLGLEGRSVKIEVETTGGTVSNISARVIYAQK